MVSYSPVKLIVEEQVPFTPPKLCQTFSQQSLESCHQSQLKEDEIISQTSVLDTSLSSTASDVRQKPKKSKQKNCGQCNNCKKDDCGQCKYCRDKIKFGGTGRKRQKCIYRKCQQMISGSNNDKCSNSPESSSLMEYNDRVSPDSSPIRPAKRKRISHQLSSSDGEPDSNDISCMIIDSPATNGLSSATNGLSSATNGQSSATNGQSSATNAQSSATNGLSSATNGLSSATNGQSSVINGDNTLSGLSPVWASIFRKPCSHDRQRSPKNSPKRPSSPCSPMSPRSSPKKGSPLKRKLSLTTSKSPQKSLSLFNTTRKQVTTAHIDHAPFDGLVHVKQAAGDISLYNTPSLLLRPSPIPMVTTGMRMSLGSITNALSKQNVMIKSSELPQENMNLFSDNVRQILHRYQTLRKELEESPVCCHGDTIIDLTSKTVNSTKRSKDRACWYGSKRMSLCCKIHIIHQSNKIMVDKSCYKIDTRRRSRRLACKESTTDVIKEEPVRKRRHSDSVSIESVEDHTSSIVSIQDHTSKLGQDSWCDFYQPRNTCDVIGNQSNVSQLLLWLKQWKDRCQGTQQPPEVSPEQRPHPLDDSLNSSLFDEEEDEGLCAAMIISGPCGVGKTAAVYACAQELGYKVLEINSTHLRTRQHIMSTLREATLSHQVMRVNEESTSDLKTSDNKTNSSNLFSFFTSQKKPVTTNITSGCGSTLTLATTTLILLEEVDILFDEECRGFWSAVYDLLLSTKRPLILTSNNPELHLDCPYKKLVFTPPTQVDLALHCRLLSLSHDYHMTTHEANQLTQHFDIRKLFNTMQFWLAGRTASTDSTHLISLEHHELVNTVGISSLLPLLVSNQLSDIRVLTPNSKYEMLDRCSSVCDLAATMDMLGSHDMSIESCDPWWSCHVTDSLTDELPNLSSCCYDYKNQCINCLTGLILKPASVGIGMSLSLPQSKEHISQVQTSQIQCSDVFHYRTVLSRQSLVTDNLPYLHIICCQEVIREKMKTSRRFTHYLQQHDLNHLLEFVKYGKLTAQ